VLYPVGVTGELLCLYAAQTYVANKKLWSLEMPNKLNVTFNYHYVLLFTMLLYIPRTFHRSVCSDAVITSLCTVSTFVLCAFDILNAPSLDGNINNIRYRQFSFNVAPYNIVVFFYVHVSMHHESLSIIVQQDATIYSFIIFSADSCTCFG